MMRSELLKGKEARREGKKGRMENGKNRIQ